MEGDGEYVLRLVELHLTLLSMRSEPQPQPLTKREETTTLDNHSVLPSSVVPDDDADSPVF